MGEIQFEIKLKKNFLYWIEINGSTLKATISLRKIINCQFYLHWTSKIESTLLPGALKRMIELERVTIQYRSIVHCTSLFNRSNWLLTFHLDIHTHTHTAVCVWPWKLKQFNQLWTHQLLLLFVDHAHFCLDCELKLICSIVIWNVARIPVNHILNKYQPSTGLLFDNLIRGAADFHCIQIKRNAQHE